LLGALLSAGTLSVLVFFLGRGSAWWFLAAGLAGGAGIVCGIGAFFVSQMAECLREQEEALRTAKDNLEREVRERTRALEETNGQLVAFNYSISHDLRAPLRAIDGFSQILMNEHSRGLLPEGRRLLGIVVKNTKQMARLIDDLLAFSRLGRQDPTMDEVDMTTLARDTFDELAAADPARKIEFQLGPLPPARGDPAMLRQVWANLLSNAVKFTGRTARSVIAVKGEAGTDGVTYSVQDNGAGFDPKFAPRLFQVFQRLHSAGEFEGTGVGLAIVQRVIQKHGGRVWAAGAPQEGATFFFTLPAGDEGR
jgi:light-regulated signal transduction histidine kinase (bacteriophytochrome)